jgi:hypothetical protein
MLDETLGFLDPYFQAAIEEGRNLLHVDVGCSGGQHRSVFVAEELYAHYKNQYACTVYHRELSRYVEDARTDGKKPSPLPLAKEEVANLLPSASDEAKRALLSPLSSASMAIFGSPKARRGSSSRANPLRSPSASIKPSSSSMGCPPHFAYTRSAGFLKRVVYHVLVGKEGRGHPQRPSGRFLRPELPKDSYATPNRGGYLSGGLPWRRQRQRPQEQQLPSRDRLAR